MIPYTNELAFEKHPDDRFKITVDFAAPFGAETIASQVVTGTGITVSDISATDSVLEFWVSGGAESTRATVAFQATSTGTPSVISNGEITLRIKS